MTKRVIGAKRQAKRGQNGDYLEIISRKLRNLERKINLQINLTRELAASAGTCPLPHEGETRQLKLNAVFLLYPQFERDFQFLLDNEFISETKNGLKWSRSKQSLSEYFGNQKHSGNKHHWQDIERLFNERNLKSSLSRNGSAFKKLSKDYMELMRMLGR